MTNCTDGGRRARSLRNHQVSEVRSKTCALYNDLIVSTKYYPATMFTDDYPGYIILPDLPTFAI